MPHSTRRGTRSGHNGTDSKSVGGKPHAGSNPALSASLILSLRVCLAYSKLSCMIFAACNPMTTAIPLETPRIDDPLLYCLVILTKLHQRPFSPEALRAGLPLTEQGLTPELFIRAAARAGLSARLIKRPLEKLTKLQLPAVLLLQDNQACVLNAQLTPTTAQIIQPESGEGFAEISVESLQEQYTGYALCVRQAYRFDARSEAGAIPRPRNWFWGTLAKSWHVYLEVLLASLLINVFALASPLFVMNVYDRVVPNHALETLWVLAIGAGIVFAFEFVMRTLRGYFIDLAGKKSDIILASMIFEQVMGTRLIAHPRSVGAFANHLLEFESFRDFFTSATLTTVVDLPFTLLFLLVIWAIGGNLVFVPIFAVPVVLFISFALQFPLRKAVEQSFRASAQKHGVLVEALAAIENIKTLQAEGVLQRRWEQLLGEIAKSSLRSRLISALAVNLTLLVQQVTTIAIVIFGVYLIKAGELSTGALIASTILTGRALAPLGQVAGLMMRYHQSRAALNALNHIMSLPLERPEEQDFVHRPELQGAVEFKNVQFQYPTQPLKTLQNISFKIQAGERVGIIGRVASGKSSLAKLLLNLYQVGEGSVLLDGIDSRQLDPADLRRNIGYVPQDSVLFYGTVKENIVMGAPYLDDAALVQAAHLAGVDEFVNQHPLGFDLPIGERGEGLSGGQRQAIALARALLHNPPILLMDEPSNAMDNSSEEQFKTRLLPYLEGKTLLLITHRTSLLSLVDRLIVVDNGQIVADGPKDAVIQALSSGRVARSA